MQLQNSAKLHLSRADSRTVVSIPQCLAELPDYSLWQRFWLHRPLQHSASAPDHLARLLERLTTVKREGGAGCGDCEASYAPLATSDGGRFCAFAVLS